MNHHPNQQAPPPHTPHTPYGAQFFDELNAGLALSAQLRLPTTQTESSSSQPQGHQNHQTNQTQQNQQNQQNQQTQQAQQTQQNQSPNPRASELASDPSIYLRPVPELPSEEDVHLNIDELMEAVHAYGVRTGCDLVRHAQKTTAKGTRPYRWMMMCSRAGNPPATTPTIRINTKSKKTQCQFGFWCIAIDRDNPLTSPYRIKTSETQSQHNHAPATFAELPNAKRRARRAGIEPPVVAAKARQGPLKPAKIELLMDFRVCVQLNPIIPVGEGPWGARNWISFRGGQFTAGWAKGTIEVSCILQAFATNRALTSRSAWRSRLASSTSRLPPHFSVDQLLDPHRRRAARFHRCPDFWLAHWTAGGDGAAPRSCEG
jgi:hypothetical protein